MTLTVEDGTGLADADAFVSRDDYKSYCDKFGYDYPDDDTLIDQGIRRGTVALAAEFDWLGEQATTTQALPFPRDLWDGLSFDVVRSTIEFSRREIAEPGAMTPDYLGAERVESETFDGVSFSYKLGEDGAADSAPTVRLVKKWLAGYISQRSGRFVTSTVARG